MKKFKWLLGMLLLALVPMLQSCDDDGYSIGDFSWDMPFPRSLRQTEKKTQPAVNPATAC